MSIPENNNTTNSIINNALQGLNLNPPQNVPPGLLGQHTQQVEVLDSSGSHIHTLVAPVISTIATNNQANASSSADRVQSASRNLQLSYLAESGHVFTDEEIEMQSQIDSEADTEFDTDADDEINAPSFDGTSTRFQAIVYNSRAADIIRNQESTDITPNPWAIIVDPWSSWAPGPGISVQTTFDEFNPTLASIPFLNSPPLRRMQNTFQTIITGPGFLQVMEPHPFANIHNNQTMTQTQTTSGDFSAALKVFQNSLDASDSSLQNFDVSSLQEDSNLCISISIWLRKLKESAAFSNEKMRPLYCRRVLSVLLYATQAPAYLKYLENALAEATTTCVDKGDLGLNYLELQKKIMQSPDASLGHTVKLLKGAFKLKCLDKIAERKIEQCQRDNITVDDVEVYLGLQVYLKKHLDLPIECESMKFISCSQLYDDDFNNALKEVSEAADNIDAVANYFLSQKVWRDRIEKEFAQEMFNVLGRVSEEMNDLFERAQEMTNEIYTNKSNALLEKKKNLEAEWLKNKTVELLKQFN